MAPDRRDLQLNALLGITQAINNNLPEEDLFRIYKFTLLGDLRVDRMALFVLEDDKWNYRVHFGTEYDWSGYELDHSFDHLQGISPLNDAPKEFREFGKVFPVLHKDRLLALLFIGEVEDATFVSALTNILIVAIENKRMAREQMIQEAYQKELEIAKKVQNFLFPKSLPDSLNLRIQAIYLPHHDVGGDYYDYIKISENKFLICVADVSGKGVPAALLMSNFQATLRVLVRRTDDLKEIVSELNNSTYRSGNGENFITFFVGIYDFTTKHFDYINCGHNPLYIIQNRAITYLDKGTTVLGMFDPLPFMESDRIENLEDFVFFGFTDGLTETFSEDDEPFGEERLEKLICDSEDLNYLHNNILQELDAFRGEMQYGDDITMLSCRVVNK